MYGYDYAGEHHDQLYTTAQPGHELLGQTLGPTLEELQDDFEAKFSIGDVDWLKLDEQVDEDKGAVTVIARACDWLRAANGSHVNPRWDVDKLSFNAAEYEEPIAGRGQTLWALFKAAKTGKGAPETREPVAVPVKHYRIDTVKEAKRFLLAGVGPIIVALPVSNDDGDRALTLLYDMVSDQAFCAFTPGLVVSEAAYDLNEEQLRIVMEETPSPIVYGFSEMRQFGFRNT